MPEESPTCRTTLSPCNSINNRRSAKLNHQYVLATLDTYQSSSINAIHRVWNVLPPELCRSPALPRFKNAVKSSMTLYEEVATNGFIRQAEKHVIHIFMRLI
uniref:Uncharacterized protein n=1 Tax=Acrobeloides nanus TaxID=290746 RepID=A0A914E6F5_9BILA